MQLDRDALNKVLSLNDRQLKNLIQRLAAESGIDPKEFNIDPSSIESIRTALGSATDDDLRRITEQYEANKRGRR
ncbi:MAG: hypothetical protein J6Q82_06995 [Clostridia bacterium]|nr:hypothetical protein [Clostridia bacterium]